MIGLIGRKLGMTQLYKENGNLFPATAIQLGPCPVVQVKSEDGTDGYNAIKLGFWESKKVKRPLKGMFDKINMPSMKILREFRLDDTKEFNAGDKISADIFKTGETVMVQGTTKGRGFAGVVKRHGFKGGDDSHGCRAKRVPGSMGGSSDPSRVSKGKKLPGHYGAKAHTVKGLEILLVDVESNVIFVKGAVPGATNGIVFVTKQA